MAQIRQEINILDHPLPSTTVGQVNSNEKVSPGFQQYNGTATYYLEVVAINTDSVDRIVRIHRSSGNLAASNITLTAGTSSYTVFRSGDIGWNSSTSLNDFDVGIDATTSANQVIIKSARIVIIQNATALTDTETQIEIGNYNTARTTEVSAILTNPKYWKYDASKWDGTKTFYAEAVYDSGDMDTVSITLVKATDILAPSWTGVVDIVAAATTTVPTRTRVAFTPVDGNWYTIFSLNGSMDNHDIYRAGIVVTSSDGSQPTQDGSNQIFGGASATQEALGQSFKIRANSTITAVKLILSKTGSPTDTLNVDITSTLGGSSLANATKACTDLTTTLTEYTLTFGTPVALTAATTYYIQVSRSPNTNDTTNYPRWGVKSTDVYSDGTAQTKSSGSWAASSTVDYSFVLVGQAGITKLEPQYLLANTLFAAGTALQTFLTDWDSTEWDDGSGSITYYFQAEAANGSTSDVTLEQADGGGTVTNSTLTNIDNAQISSAMTMPGDENLDTKATTNAGDVAAARILVAYVFSAALSGSLKTKKGLALASVKTFKGLATASVKTGKGLALT